jgi:hypothetical protein
MKTIKKLLSAALILAMAIGLQASVLPYVTLAWDSNTGPELKGYSIYCVEDDGSHTWLGDWDEVELEDPLNPQVTIQGLDPRDFYYFVATAYSDTVESDYSNQACGKLLGDKYVDCDYQEPEPKPDNGGGSGGGGCFISALQGDQI